MRNSRAKKDFKNRKIFDEYIRFDAEGRNIRDNQLKYLIIQIREIFKKKKQIYFYLLTWNSRSQLDLIIIQQQT